MKPKLVRITTVPMSLHYLLRGQLRYMNENGFEVVAISADGPERQHVLNEGIAHYIIPFTRQVTPIRDLICLLKLIFLFRRLKPHIVHTHTPKAGLLGMLAAWICRVRVRMHTVAGLPMMEAKGLKRWVLKITERVTYACAHRVYPNSKGLLEYIRNEFQVAGTDATVSMPSAFPVAGTDATVSMPSAFQVVGNGSTNGIDTNYFTRSEELAAQAREIRKRYSISDGAIVFCFIGRVVKDKGIRELLEAFKKFGAERNDVFLLLIGPLEQELDPLSQEAIHFIEQHPGIVMPGFQPDVRPWLMAADVFVFPSYREGFPNVVMQAACMEIPCIVSDINGCNELIQHQKTGLLVPAKDAGALFQAMDVLAGDPDLRASFGKQSRTFVVQHFEQEYVWQAWLRQYQAF